MTMPSWRNLLARLPQNAFVRSAALVASGSVVGQAIMVAVAPVLSRLYQPADFGAFAVFASTVGILAIIASLRYEIAIPLPPNEREAWALARLALAAAAVVSGLLLISVWVWGPHYMAVFGISSDQTILIYLIPIGIVLTSLYQISNYLIIRQGRHELLAKGKILQGGTAATLQTGLGYTPLGPAGLAIGMMLGRFAASIYALASLNKTSGKSVGLMVVARRYIRFPKLALPSGAINALSVEMPLLLGSYLYGTDTAGFYALAQRVVVTPLSMIGKSIAQVYMSALGERVRERDPAAILLFTGVARRLFLLGAVPFLLLGLLAPSLFGIAFGERWYASGILVRILAPAFLAQFVVVPLSQTLNFISRQDYQLAWDIARFAGVAGSFALAYWLGLNYIFAFAAFSILLTLAYAVLYLVMLTALRRAVSAWQTSEGGGSNADIES